MIIKTSLYHLAKAYICYVLKYTTDQNGGHLIRSRNCLDFASTWVHPLYFGGVHIAHLFTLLSYGSFLFVSCVSNVAIVSGLSILDCPFGFF